MTNGKIVFLAVPVYSECWIMLPLNFLGKSNNIFWPLKPFRKILWVPDDYPPKKRTQTKRAKPNKLVRDFQIQERQLFCTLTCHCGTLLHFIRRKKSCELCLGSYSYCIWLIFGTRLLLSVVSRSITRSIICIHLTSSYVLETYEERIVKSDYLIVELLTKEFLYWTCWWCWTF